MIVCEEVFAVERIRQCPFTLVEWNRTRKPRCTGTCRRHYEFLRSTSLPEAKFHMRPLLADGVAA
jgi:hypothetical protein